MQCGPPLPRRDAVEIAVSGKTFLVHTTLLGTPYPQTLSLEATNFCNLCCSHCGHSQYPGFSKGHFDMKYFEKIRHLLGSEIKGISLSNFGEPFMSKAWSDLLKRSLALGSPGIFFITNGLLLDRHIDEILNPRISMAVSIDGASEKTYSSFRGKGKFSKLTANLALLREAKSAKRISYPEVTFLFTASRLNCEDLPRIVDMAGRFGVKSVIVQLQVFFDRERFGLESLFFAQDEYDRNIAAALKRASALGVTILHPDSFDGHHAILRSLPANSWLGRDDCGRIRCFSQSVVCYVKYNGTIEACCSPDHAVMGSLDFDTFEDIWHGPEYRRLRLALDRGILPAMCRCCNLFQAIDVHDERAHLIELPNSDPGKRPEPQRYRVTELETAYQQALSLLGSDPGRALSILGSLSDIDGNLYEVRNLQACIRGLCGDISAMHREFTECASVAPRDPVIARNCAKFR